MNKIITGDFLKDNRDTFIQFGEWYNLTNKTDITKVNLKAFFDISFELQLGYYLEWFASLGVFVSSRIDHCNNDLMLKLVYTKDPNINFKYHDIDEVNTSHFKGNPLEAYELLIASFIYKCQFPF